MEKLYTIKEFCTSFMIHRDTFYTWKEKGVVKPIRVGGSVRITEREVNRILKSQKEE
jgi:excisionase family DNA binding protein